jgi:hypothetical protein
MAHDNPSPDYLTRADLHELEAVLSEVALLADKTERHASQIAEDVHSIRSSIRSAWVSVLALLILGAIFGPRWFLH